MPTQAADIVHVVGIGRNEYINLMNQCKARKLVSLNTYRRSPEPSTRPGYLQTAQVQTAGPNPCLGCLRRGCLGIGVASEQGHS